MKREQLALKAFVTACCDTYRQPYARVATTKPRRTSFCATVNPQEFLNDETGSRRWWVVEPTKIDCQKLKELPECWFQQMWAQVYTELYLRNPQGFRLTEEERIKLQADNEKYNKPLPGETEILDKLAWESPVGQWRWYTSTDLRDELLLKPLTPVQIGKALRKLAEKDKRIATKNKSGKNWYYLPPKDENLRYYHHVDDYKPTLANLEVPANTSKPKAS